MIEWFKDDKNIPKFFTDFEDSYQRIPFEDETVQKSARYNGVLCLIMKKGASDPMIRFSDENKTHIDHIFPKSKSEKVARNSILNMTWLTDITNITKSAKMPKEYYTEIRKNLYDDDDSSCGEYDADGNYLGGTLRSAIYGSELAAGTYLAKAYGYSTSESGTLVLSIGHAAAVDGCTDPYANNYDPDATTDDGTCDYSCTANQITVVMGDNYGDTWNGGTMTIGDDFLNNEPA